MEFFKIEMIQKYVLKKRAVFILIKFFSTVELNISSSDP